MKINRIEIKYFRSIEYLELKPKQMNIFVGLNNTGKSNVLKALNLFFNGNTGYNERFIFEHDHYKYDRRVGKNISIEITFELPSTYKKVRYVREKKTWLPTGNISRSRTYTRFYDDNDDLIADKNSKGHAEAYYKQKEYVYVPAIRGKEYFSLLLGDMYDILNSHNSASNIKSSSSSLEKSLSNILSPLLDELEAKTPGEQNNGEREQVSIPDDIRHIFENLDIRTSSGISLNRRGDGVRSWQVPIILKYIYDMVNKGKGRSRAVFWGIEEPENNVELSSAYKIAELLLEYSNFVQSFITTHSPAVYSLTDNYPNKVSLRHVSMSTDDDDIKSVYSDSDLPFLNEEIGLMAFIAPALEKEKEKWKEAQKKKSQFEKEVIFVEGNSDKIIVEKVLRIINRANEFNVISCNGANQTTYLIKSWTYYQFLRSKKKALVILDNDEKGKEVYKEINEYMESLSTKLNRLSCVKKLKENLIVAQCKSKNIEVTVDLESYYSEKIWNYANEQNYLVDLSDEQLSERIRRYDYYKTLGEQIELFKNEASNFEVLIGLKEVDGSKKEILAEYVANLENFEEEMVDYIRFILNQINICFDQDFS